MLQDKVIILERVLHKAHKNGYRFNGVLEGYQKLTVDPNSLNDRSFNLIFHYPFQTQTINLNLSLLLFDILFAQAFFGDYWETHLNLLAVSSSPIEYLSDYLNSIPMTN